MIEKRRYVHRNPVRRGLVMEPDGWRWSSFRHWWSGEEGTVEIESNWTAARRDGLGIEVGEGGGNPHLRSEMWGTRTRAPAVGVDVREGVAMKLRMDGAS